MKFIGIMATPHFGMRGTDKPVFWFSVTYGPNLRNYGIVTLSMSSMFRHISEMNAYDLADLENKLCQIDVKDDAIEFLKIIDTSSFQKNTGCCRRHQTTK